MRRSVYILFVGLLLLGCSKENRWDCFTSLGSIKSEFREVGEFHSIYISDRIDLEYRRSEDYRVEVIFGENILKHIKTDVSDGALTISNDARCNWVRDLSEHPLVRISAPSFDYFENRSTGDITFIDTLETVAFKYEQWESNGVAKLKVKNQETELVMHVGYCEIEIEGITELAQLYSAAVGKLKASKLQSPVTLANNAAIQEMRLFASEYLFAAINSSGDILYDGDPELIETDIVGSGSVSPL